ncbi:MAG: cbb3-type cytochrome c oxidase subunit I, partial [Bacteriovoracaceae bacterium]
MQTAQAKDIFEKTWATPSGVRGWASAVNNQVIGKRFIVTGLIFFLIGGALALLLRIQLAVSGNTFLGPDAYNELFTMHGSTMMYLFAAPFLEGLAVYFMPLMIGSRDLAFPRLSAFSYWAYLFGGLIFYASFFFGEVPDAGWFSYTPLSGPKYAGIGLDFWLLGLGLVEISGIATGVEIVVTILKFRAMGMSLNRMPLFVWTLLAMGLMIVFAFTTLLTATFMLELDRTVGTNFFNPNRGGSSLLWQHLFWFFGHPEVYIIFLPATGIVSTLVGAFSKRSIVGYNYVVAAIVVTAFVSFGLWAHHMFTTGLPELASGFFTAASLAIGIATGVQVFAWIATLWGSKPSFSTPMLYLLGFFFIFVLGGLTGIMLAVAPFDWQVHDTFFVVAHFHYVLIGGVVFPAIGGLYFWLPKITGKMLNEKLGKWGFWVAFVGFNATFFPMHIMGLLGMPRRVYTYQEELGL